METHTENITRAEIAKKFNPELENLLLILTEVQNRSNGNYIRKEDMVRIADFLNITTSAVYGVVKYYSMFSTSPRGRFVFRLCKSPVCGMMGAETVACNLESLMGSQEGPNRKETLCSYEKVECLGHCDKAPAMMVNDEVYGNVNQEEIERIISMLKTKI